MGGGRCDQHFIPVPISQSQRVLPHARLVHSTDGENKLHKSPASVCLRLGPGYECLSFLVISVSLLLPRADNKRFHAVGMHHTKNWVSIRIVPQTAQPSEPRAQTWTSSTLYFESIDTRHNISEQIVGVCPEKSSYQSGIWVNRTAVNVTFSSPSGAAL